MTVPKGVGAWARFLRAGGVVDLATWRGILSPDDRDALEAAGELVAAERAALVAHALAPHVMPAAPRPDPLEAAGRAALAEAAGRVS